MALQIRNSLNHDWKTETTEAIAKATFRPFYMPVDELENNMKLFPFVQQGRLRDASCRYNPETVHFQRVPTCHAWSNLRQEVEDAAMFCMLYARREQLATYPSFK